MASFEALVHQLMLTTRDYVSQVNSYLHDTEERVLQLQVETEAYRRFIEAFDMNRIDRTADGKPFVHAGAPKSQEEVVERCNRGEQWCIICRDFSCGDNMNTHEQKIVALPPQYLDVIGWLRTVAALSGDVVGSEIAHQWTIMAKGILKDLDSSRFKVIEGKVFSVSDCDEDVLAEIQISTDDQHGPLPIVGNTVSVTWETSR